jgi:hypothetical protein
MESSKVGYWLQVGANVGILAGLVLVGIQINQNTEMVRLQMLDAESQRVTGGEYVLVGEKGAAAWAKAILEPANLTFEEQRIVEALIWPAFENWEHAYRMHQQGLLGEEWIDRVSSETAYWLDHVYGRAWWENFKAMSVENEIPSELRELIDQLLSDSDNFHVVYHREIMDRVRSATESSAQD